MKKIFPNSSADQFQAVLFAFAWFSGKGPAMYPDVKGIFSQTNIIKEVQRKRSFPIRPLNSFRHVALALPGFPITVLPRTRISKSFFLNPIL